MELRLLVLTTCILFSTSQGFYIQMHRWWNYKWQPAKALCESHGMTLPVLPTVVDVDLFWSVVETLSLRESYTLQPWVGLSLNANSSGLADVFTWADGQPFSPAVPGELAYNETAFSCVRMLEEELKTCSCDWRRDTVCMGNFDNTAGLTPTFYIKEKEVNMTASTLIHFVKVVSESQLPVPLSMRSVDPWAGADSITCFQVCAVEPACRVVAVLRDKTACYVQAAPAPSPGIALLF